LNESVLTFWFALEPKTGRRWMEKEIEQRRTIKVIITLDVPLGDEVLAHGLMDRVITEHIRDCEAFRDYGVDFEGWDIEFGEEYQRETE